MLVKLFVFVVTLVTGGGVGAWSNPDLPVLGPLVKNLVQRGGGLISPGSEKPGSVLADIAGRLGSPAASGLPAAQGPTDAASAKPSNKPADTVAIATFNIQVFGTSKMSKPWIVDVLAKVARQFDIVAIQEVRSKDDGILPAFVAAINADGSRYDFVIGPRLGRTTSTEQYAFVYDTQRIEVNPSSVGTMQDPTDLLHREPMIAQFRSRIYPPDRAFSFWLVNIHTDPDEVPQEIDALAGVFQVMRSAFPDEDDVILLGDLNASEHELGRLGQLPGMNWVVRETTTNTRRTKAYDNILFDGRVTGEYNGRWGVLDVQNAFGLSAQQALEVSDHFPVWAEFSTRETSGQNLARVPEATPGSSPR